MDNKDLIISEISSAITSVLGTSAAAVMRKAGRQASLHIWPDLPSGKSVAEAGEIMAQGVSALGGFGDFKMVPGDDPSSGVIEFKDCAFSAFVEASGQPCGQQAICFFGFGLVEETFFRLTGTRAKIELVSRDDGTKICFETATPR
jgi:predicted hydrocarbon binding protein